MNRIFATLGLLVVVSLGLVSPAQATGNHNPEVSGKPVTLCHATGSSTNPYVRLENVPLVQFLGHNGHEEHSGDIWAAFSYVVRDSSDTWHTVNVPAQGDTSLLAFDKCKQPREDTPVAKPDATYNDLCGTKNDVFSVPDGEGYSVSQVVNEGSNQVITATLDEGFKWSDGSVNPVRYVRPAFTNEDCDLPETGSAAVYNTPAGLAAVAGIVTLGAITLISTRRRKA